jgi:hypothetical protein
MWYDFSISPKTLKFNQKSFDENDNVGRTLLIDYLVNKGHEVYDNEDLYGIDLYSFKDDKQYWWEVEMKSFRPWTCKKDFPFDSVSFLDRKAKWKDKNFWYVIICKETKAAIFCQSNIIFDEKYKQKLYINTQERKGADNFFRVPKDLCIFVPTEEFT